MSNLVSVVVCTYNRADLINGCLDSLAEQTAVPSSFEVLLIDNNSTDGTYQLVESYSRLTNFRVFREEKQGLSHARNRGMQEARGNYIAYLDDDARAECHYVENIHSLLEQFADTIDCFGGPILPFYTTPKPDWIKEDYEIRRNRPNAGFLTKGQTFSGSNMVWKKSVVEVLGGFNPEVGIRGDELILGEETLLFDRLWDTHKPNLYYSPDLVVYHWVPEQKMKIRYRLKRALANGLTMGKIETRNISLFRKIPFLFKHLGWSFLNMGRAVIHVGRHRRVQHWVVEEIGPVLMEFGSVLAVLRLYPNIKQ